MPTDPPHWVLQQRQTVGRRIRTLRVERGLSQERLAEEAGVHRHTVYRTELATHSVSIDALALMAHALGAPIWQLFREEPPGPGGG
ncbi:helix-turn-helix transcriptional regulator [Kitasatospora sp. NBC_01302]|uniref:helix-turn-helix transcriptional regulator n=1 Tax=Kitasatospora sp. NBC_01302 TaxID=2903575 RepID=UPI003FA34F54